MLSKKSIIIIVTSLIISACFYKEESLDVAVVETSASGHKWTPFTEFAKVADAFEIKLAPKKELQTITGFGRAFTESSAYLLNKLRQENRKP